MTLALTLTSEQTRVLAVLDVVREAIATGQEIELADRLGGSDIWIPSTIETAITLREHERFKFRIKQKPEIVRFRLGFAVQESGFGKVVIVAYGEENEGYWLGSPRFLGWAGPWQEVDVSTLTKDEQA